MVVESSEYEAENDDQDINEESSFNANNFTPREEHSVENTLDSLDVDTLQEDDVELLTN